MGRGVFLYDLLRGSAAAASPPSLTSTNRPSNAEGGRGGAAETHSTAGNPAHPATRTENGREDQK